MNETISEFIRAKKIDSIYKLNLLLFLHQNPDVQGTSRCFAEKLYLGDIRLVDKVVAELADRGVINYSGQHYFLANTPEIKVPLQHLAHSYEHPLSRQTLLKRIQAGGQLEKY